MTDNEIKFSISTYLRGAGEYKNGAIVVSSTDMIAINDLINRQQADVRKLQLENEKLEIKLKCNIESSIRSTNSAMKVIKKQDAEIEDARNGVKSFKSKYKNALDVIRDKQEYIERLQDETLILSKKTKELVNNAKAEAIKEFAERLKNEYSHTLLPPIGYPIDKNDWIVYREDIEDLVEEMVGEDETT